MSYSPRPWPVVAHEPIAKLEENLWTVSSRLPLGPMDRRMSMVRLSDGRLVLHNTVPLSEPELREVEAFGTPSVLIVPAPDHRLGIREWKGRYPALRVVCPAGIRARVAEAVPVDGGWEALPADPALVAMPLAGSRTGEAALVVRSPRGRASLLFGDTVMNIPHEPGLGGLLLRLIGSSGGPRVTRLARMLYVRDSRALADALLRLADTPGLVRLVPSHGDVVQDRAAEVLREVARRLS
jgi:hypothetical protein